MLDVRVIVDDLREQARSYRGEEIDAHKKGHSFE
jgi:hypothetical protein